MIDHVGFAVSDYASGKAFYTQALAPLGYVLVMEVAADQNQSGFPAAGFGIGANPDSGSAAKANWKSHCISRSWPATARR